MSNHTSQGAVPSLVEVFKQMACNWQSIYDQAEAQNDPDAEDNPAVALEEKYWDDPIVDLFRLIEETTGIPRETLERVALRINTPLGLAPLKRARRLVAANTARDDFFDVPTRPDQEDLRCIYEKFNACDVNGSTATILRRFRDMHPGKMDSQQSAQLTAIPTTPFPPADPPVAVTASPRNLLGSGQREGYMPNQQKKRGPKKARFDPQKDKERSEEWEAAKAAGQIRTYHEFEKEKGYSLGSTKPMVKRHKERERGVQ